MRAAFALILVAGICALGTVALGRAMDTETQDRVIFTRGGVTLDCARRVLQKDESVYYEDGSSYIARKDGEVGYEDCNIVP